MIKEYAFISLGVDYTLKKFLALLLMLVLLLSACTGDTNNSSAPDVSLPAEQSEVSEEASETVSASPEHSASKAEVESAANELTARDAYFVRIIAGGDLSGGKLTDAYGTVKGVYKDYGKLMSELQSLYADNSVYTRMLTYPDYGGDNFVNQDGSTKYKYLYINDFAASLAVHSVTVTAFDDKSAVLSVSASGKKYKMEMVYTDGEWRLTDSILFVYLASEREIQVNAGWENSIYIGTRQNSGSLPKLNGRLLVLNVFVDDSFSAWEEVGREKVKKSVEEACTWLEAKTRDYAGANTVIETKTLYYVHGNVVPQTFHPAFLDSMFQNTVYGDVNGYIEKNVTGEYDGVCVLFHVWKSGKSYVIPCDTANTDYLTYFGERAMFYHTQHYTPSASYYVSALLRLAGGEYLFESEYSAVLKDMFPYDIMLAANADNLPLQDYEVSPLTAFFIGWNGYIDTQLIPYTFIEGDRQ